MHLTRMRLGGIPPFTEPVEFKFDERVNVFVGPNASGKTTVLLVLADKFIGMDKDSKRPISQGMDPWRLSEFSNDEFDEFVQDELERGEQPNVVAASEDWFGTKWELHRPEIAPVFIHIEPIRNTLPGISELEAQQERDETVSEILSGRFSGTSVFSVITGLAKELWREDDEATKGARGNAMKSIEIADICSKLICSGVIRDTRSRNYIPGPDVRGYLNHPHADPGNITILRQMGIDTNDTRNFNHLSFWEQPSLSAYPENSGSPPLYLGHLSSGTEGTLLWIRWLALKMLHHYEFRDDWQNQPAILLIDEIENHLHPTWQRRVIPALLEYFPGLQIFATTHSPFVVAGREVGQVHQLIRDTNGLITAKTNTEPIKGLTADEISRKYLEVQDPTDLATAEAAAELRKLRNDGPRDTEDAEAARQTRMQELRRLVDRDLLAGGPMAARRELFEQQFNEALEKYRQSRDLGQDSG